MLKINFTKMVASGNDFVVIDKLQAISYKLQTLARILCDRKYGIGADGLLILEKSKGADIRMRIFNSDGSEAQMCGNGARCAALYKGRKSIKIITKAGIVAAQLNGDNIKIKLTDPKDLKLNFPLRVSGRVIRVNFINTGVPHAVIFVEGLGRINVVRIGREIRQDKKFAPGGTNVNFIEILAQNLLKIRTYERGVEDETLACGTGSAASSLIAYRLSLIKKPVKVLTRSGENAV
ncbi:MAG: diaminopimelate epimerase [Candidatus Omnitrophica bacterium]|nr:diaminopimelate epimerase [Candidatus Omnitrophota bacterium]